jgi:hypothetical protein
MIGNSLKAYTKELEGFTEMLATYSIQASIAVFHMNINEHGTVTMNVCLEPGSLSQGAAELIEWRRTLVRPEAMIERSPNGPLGVPDIVTGALGSAGELVVLPIVLGAVYPLVRWIEPRLPAWLTRVLLGSAQPPTYSNKPEQTDV